MEVVWLACAVLSAFVGSNRGGSGPGWFFAGLVFGPIGFLFSFTAGKECPFCKSSINTRATVCPKCQKELPVKKRRKGNSKSLIILGVMVVVTGGIIAAASMKKSHDTASMQKKGAVVDTLFRGEEVYLHETIGPILARVFQRTVPMLDDLAVFDAKHVRTKWSTKSALLRRPKPLDIDV